MGRKSRNKKSPSENIIELLRRIKERGYLEDFEAELNQRKGTNGYKSIYKLLNDFIEQDRSLEEIPSDLEWGKQLGKTEIQFTTIRKDFYNRVLDFSLRFINKPEKWYVEALSILKEVDVLWALELFDQAEMRFVKIYKVYPNDDAFQRKYEYNYVMSKVFYYGYYFFTHKSYIGMEEDHKEFFQQEQFQVIKELESVASRMDISQKIYAKPEKWDINQAVFNFHNLLAMLAKQKGQYAAAKTALNEQEDMYKELAVNFLIQGIRGKRHFNFFTDLEPQNVDEIETAFYFYIKMEELRLSFMDGDKHETQTILNELYQKLNETFEKSRGNLAAIILFLRLELEQSELALSLSPKDLDSKVREFEGSFFATKKEIESLPVRMEINRMRFDFFTSPEIPNYEKAIVDIKALDGWLKGTPVIKLDLFVLKLLICFESHRYEDIKEIIRTIKYAAKDTGRDNTFLNKFLIRFSNINYADSRGFNKAMNEILTEIEPLRNTRYHLDNFIAFWLRQFGSRKKIVV